MMERTLRQLKSKNDVNPGDLMSLYNQVLTKLNTIEHHLEQHAKRINEQTKTVDEKIIPAIGRAELHLFALIKQAIRGGMQFSDLQQDIQELVQAPTLEQYWGTVPETPVETPEETYNGHCYEQAEPVEAELVERVETVVAAPESTGYMVDADQVISALEGQNIAVLPSQNTDRAQLNKLARWPKKGDQ